MKKYLLIATLLAAFIGLGGCEPGPYKPDRTEACLICQKFVEKALKAPASADHPGCLEADVKHGVEGIWRVETYVDAENAFGATLRTRYVCDVKVTRADKWALVDLQVR